MAKKINEKKAFTVTSRLPCTLALCLFAALGACVPGPEVTSASGGAGRDTYLANCAQCHGADAAGGGPASLGLGGPPPPLHTLAFGNGGVFPRAYVSYVIRGKVGSEDPDKSMPDFSKQGFDHAGPQAGKLSPSPGELADLLDYLESIQL